MYYGETFVVSCVVSAEMEGCFMCVILIYVIRLICLSGLKLNNILFIPTAISKKITEPAAS
jgi:hypothetical protein